MNATSKMTITAAATRTVPMLRLIITLSSLPLSFIPSRAARQGTLPAKESSATVRQPVRLCVPSNRSMSPIIAPRSNRFGFHSSRPRAQRRRDRRVREEEADGSHHGALGRLALSLHQVVLEPTRTPKGDHGAISRRRAEMQQVSINGIMVVDR